MYDKPGTGASDPIDVAPPVEERIDQLVDVMDAAGLSRPTVVGVSEGGATACLAAAARPDRVGRLVMLDATACLFDPRGKGEMSDAEHEAWKGFIRRTAETWGEGRDGDIWLAGARDADRAWGVLQRACASPAVARRYYESWADGLSAWDALPTIRQPTLILSRTDDRVLPIKAARVAAERIPSAKMVELPGAEHLPWLGDTAEILAQLRDFVGAPQPVTRAERVLATILFTDLVGSSEQLGRLGDAAWTARLDRHARIVARRPGAFRRPPDQVHGRRRPRRLLRARARNPGCALDPRGATRRGPPCSRRRPRRRDRAPRRRHRRPRRPRVGADHEQAAGDEVLVSRTVRDLTAGSGLRFEDRGTHSLKGIPDDWQLYALA